MRSPNKHYDSVLSPTFCFDLSAAFTHPMKILLHGWNSPTPFHWYSQNDNEILATGAFLQSPGLPLLSLTDHEGRRLEDNIPEPVLEVIRLAPFLDFEIAQASASSGAALQLAEDCPLLLILAVHHAKRARLARKDFHTLLCQRRPTLLEKIGLPGSQSLNRLIKRIALAPMLPRELDDAIQVLCTDRVQPFLRHHRNLHLNHLLFLARYRQVLWPGLLFLVDVRSRSGDFPWLCRMIRDVMALTNQNESLLRQVCSREGLQELHDRLVDRFNQEDSQQAEKHHKSLAIELEREHGLFPKPPLPEVEGITALSSWFDLLNEGAIMRHCVGSYDDIIASGEVFIYRMHQPERLTIAVRRKGPLWILSEARGKRNSNPSEEAMERIQRWLATFGLA